MLQQQMRSVERHSRAVVHDIDTYASSEVMPLCAAPLCAKELRVFHGSFSYFDYCRRHAALPMPPDRRRLRCHIYAGALLRYYARCHASFRRLLYTLPAYVRNTSGARARARALSVRERVQCCVSRRGREDATRYTTDASRQRQRRATYALDRYAARFSEMRRSSASEYAMMLRRCAARKRHVILAVMLLRAVERRGCLQHAVCLLYGRCVAATPSELTCLMPLAADALRELRLRPPRCRDAFRDA